MLIMIIFKKSVILRNKKVRNQKRVDVGNEGPGEEGVDGGGEKGGNNGENAFNRKDL